VFVQQVVAEFGRSFIEFPPIGTPASFDLEVVREQIVKAITAQQGL